jgi:alpha-mannosidase
MRRSCTTLVAIPLSCLICLTLTCLMLLAAAHAQSADKPDLAKQPTLYVVAYAHLDTEWRWEHRPSA